MISPSRLIVLTALLLLPFSRSASSAAIDLPPIQANCTSDPKALPYLSLSGPLSAPLSVDLLEPAQVTQLKKIESLIRAKQWDQAFLKFQQASTWVQDHTLQPLLVELVRSNQTDRASRFVTNRFPAQSKQRAQGIGWIAMELTNRNQFSDAIALLKSLPQDSNYLNDAIIPIVGALTSTNQMRRIPTVTALLHKPEQQWALWLDIGWKIPVEPAQVQLMTEMIQHPSSFSLRSEVLANMAKAWLSENRRNLLNAWNIANQIEDCTIRTQVFFDVVKAMKGFNLSKTQTGRALDQLEALMKTIDPQQIYPSNPSYFHLTLAKLNAQYGHKSQAIRLLEQVTEDLQRSNSANVRPTTLIELATQYQSLGNSSVAVRMLDSAVSETHAAYKEQISPSYTGLRSLGSPAQVRDARLEEIAKLYRSLNQPQKAAEIERTLPKR